MNDGIRAPEVWALLSDVAEQLLVADSGALDGRIESALGRVGAFLGVDRASVFLLTKDGQSVSKSHEWCAQDTAPQKQRLQSVSLLHLDWWWQQIVQKVPIRVSDVAALPPQAATEQALLESLGIRSVCAVPIQQNEEAFGFISFELLVQTHHWDVTGLSLLASLIGSVLSHTQVEQHLTMTLKTLNAILESTRDGILAVDDRGGVLLMNQPFRQMWHLPDAHAEVAGDDDLLAYALPQLVDPQGFLEKVQALYGSDEASEDLLELTDGRCFERYSLPLMQGDAVVGRVWSFHDITHYRRSEQAAVSAQERLDLAQSICGMGTWERVLDSDELYWSNGIYPLLGYSEGECEVSNANYLNVVYPDDLPALLDARRAAVEEGVPLYIEHRIVRPDGSLRWLLLQGSMVRANHGQTARMLGVIQDVTDQVQLRESWRKQSEFQALVAHIAADFLLATSSNFDEKVTATLGLLGAFFDVDRCDFFMMSEDNTTLVAVHDWCRPGIESKKTVMEHFPVDLAPWYKRQIVDERAVVHIEDVDALPVEAAAEQALLKEIGVKSALSVPLQSPDRVFGLMGFDAVSTHKSWPTEHIRGLMIVAQVIGNAISRIHHEATLIELKEKADRANQAKSDFLSSMSHELRTPMNAILGFSQILEYDTGLTQEQQESVHEILKAGHHLLELISEVLDLSRVESGQLDLSLQRVEVCSVAEECLRLIQPQAQKREIRIQPSGLEPAWVFADRTRLKQVLLNLLSNAVKYNREGGQIKLSLSHEQGRLRILVSDTGQGIPRDKLAELFQPFNRLGAEGSHIEGTGIGLTISRRLMEMMGGNVDVQSEVGVGSTFWLELPLESSDVNGANEF